MCYTSDGTLNTKSIKFKCLPEERHLKMVDTVPFKVLSHGFGQKKKKKEHSNSTIVDSQFLALRPYNILTS